MNKFNSFYSSSSGNCYLYQLNETNILVDMGASCKQIVNKLNDIKIDINQIDAILITHEHSDHVKGLEVFLKKYDKQVYITQKTYDNLKFSFSNYVFINPWEEIIINDVKIKILKTSHDSSESIGFLFNDQIVHITDTGYLSTKLQAAILGKQTYIIESNYEDEKLMTNPNYPFYTKQRIMSDKGHLSNFECSKYLKNIVNVDTKHIFFAHLSIQNNKPDLVLSHNQELDVDDMAILSPDLTSTHLL